MKFVFAGQGVPAPMYPIGSYGVAGGADAYLQPYPYDPQRAKQLLAEAGYPNGFDTKIYSYVTADLPELQRLSEAVADYLGKVGVRAKITPMDRAALSTKRKAKTPLWRPAALEHSEPQRGHPDRYHHLHAASLAGHVHLDG